MIQVGSGVAGLYSSGSGFHQSVLTLSFGRWSFPESLSSDKCTCSSGMESSCIRSPEGDIEEEEAEASEKIIMLPKYLEHLMHLLEEVDVVAIKVETQEEFLATHDSFFSSYELPPDQLDIDLNNLAPMTSAKSHTSHCECHEPCRSYLQTFVVEEFPSYQ
ncbi:hypothetical protein Tco_0447962 [Tanacetum coccineum]